MNLKKIMCNLDLLLACVALAILVVVTFGGVIMRYLVNAPIIWAEEVQLWCFLWLTFLGGGAASRCGSHVAVEIVVEQLPLSVQRIIEIVDYIIVVLVLAYLCYLGTDIVALAMKTNKVTQILNVPFTYINSIICICCVTMIISATYAFKNRLAEFKKLSASAVIKEA